MRAFTTRACASLHRSLQKFVGGQSLIIFFLLEIRLLRLQIENYKNEVEKHKSEAQQQKNRNVFLRNRLEEVTREKEELREGFNICHLGSNSGTAHRQH